jgi:ABC-type Fe3+-hydroxamate transport system substrate-binding protein
VGWLCFGLVFRLRWEQVLAYAPDVLILTLSTGIGEGTLGEMSSLASQPGWWALPAVQTGRVYVVEPSRFTRPGPR